jgi:hypothetical protein
MAASTSSVKRKRGEFSSQDWVPHKAEIERLYLKENKGLPAVMDIMRKKHGFEASYAKPVP